MLEKPIFIITCFAIDVKLHTKSLHTSLKNLVQLIKLILIMCQVVPNISNYLYLNIKIYLYCTIQLTHQLYAFVMCFCFLFCPLTKAFHPSFSKNKVLFWFCSTTMLDSFGVAAYNVWFFCLFKLLHPFTCHLFAIYLKRPIVSEISLILFLLE